MPISEELKKKANQYRDSIANVKAEEAKAKAEEQRKKAEQEKRERTKQDREVYNRRLQESRRVIERINNNRYNPRQIRNSRNAKTFAENAAENAAENNRKQETVIDTKPVLVNDEQQEELIAQNNSLPVLSEDEIQIAKEQVQPVQETKPAEQTPVEESITQPIIPINAQDYQLGEYQVDNTVPNSSIGYVMPPIERKSLEMPQSDDSEQISSVRDFLSGVSSIPAYVYHNKVVPFIDETREKLFGPSEEELARRAAEEEQERLRLEEEARIAREQFVQDSIQHDINQRTEDILARIAAMDTSYVVGRYNGRNLVSGLATPGSSRFIGTNRKQKTNVRGYNILAPWNNWSILDENTTAKSIEDNHFIEGNKHQRYGNVDPSVARYISIDEEGNLLFTDTIPRGIRGQITTGYASTGNLSDSFKRDKSIRYPKVYYNDGTESYPIFSWINPYNLNSVYHPVQAAVLFDLPNGEKSWIIPYGRTANQFYNDVSKIKNITGDDELEFVNFDSRSATGAYGDAGIRYNKFGSYPSLILRRKFGGDMRRSLAKGGRLKARNGEESENSQQTNIANFYPMSLQDYIAQRIQDTRDSAVNVMNTREYPRVYYNSSPDYIAKYINDKKASIKEIENNIIKGYESLYRDGVAKKKDSNLYTFYHNYIENERGFLQRYQNDIDSALKHGKAPEGATCIFTVTDSYGNKRAVPGNMSWLAKGKSGRPIYEEKGFQLLKPTDTLIQGDIIQQVKVGIPDHSMMYMGERKQDDSYPGHSGRFVDATYSNGGYDEYAMKRNEPVLYVPGNDNAFRFVGNAADSARWTREYNELMQNRHLVEHAMGGKVHRKRKSLETI